MIPIQIQHTIRWVGNILGPAIVLLIGLLWPASASANGIPVQVFLDHLPFKTTWADAAGARGVAVIHANDENVRVRVQDLPAPPARETYFVWLEKVEGGFLPVGAMTYNNDGTASLDQIVPNLPYSENFSWVLVSVEAPGSVGATPAPAIALAGHLPNALALPASGNDAPGLLPVTGASAVREAENRLIMARWWLVMLLSLPILGLALKVAIDKHRSQQQMLPRIGAHRPTHRRQK